MPGDHGDKYIVNGQKTWTSLGHYGEWIFCLVRTSNEGKPQTGISFLLVDTGGYAITRGESSPDLGAVASRMQDSAGVFA